jgi:hypothetical protein
VFAIAASNGAAAGYAMAFWMAVLGTGVVTLLKGRQVAFLLGLLTIGFVWIVAACRLAQPDSIWARHFYGERQRARARARHA